MVLCGWWLVVLLFMVIGGVLMLAVIDVFVEKYNVVSMRNECIK